MTIPKIAASLMAADGAYLANAMTALDAAGVDLWHWDIMDGHFVPNLTFGPGIVAACRHVSKREFDIHLMVTDPKHWIDPFRQAGADYLTIHAELGAAVPELIQAIRQAGCHVGIAVNPDTSPDSVPDSWIAQSDRLLLMSVRPGFGGQAFIDITAKIRTARERWPNIEISVDGGINTMTAAAVREAGADILVSGSGIFSSPADLYATRLNELRGVSA